MKLKRRKNLNHISLYATAMDSLVSMRCNKCKIDLVEGEFGSGSYDLTLTEAINLADSHNKIYHKE